MSIGEDVIDEVVECLDLYEHGEEESLRHMIPNDAYLTNFRALAKAIAPDGKDVDAVGFTLVRDGREKSITLRRSRQQQVMPGLLTETVSQSKGKKVVVKGNLRFADALEEDHNIIKLVDSQGKQYSIIVPPGMMDDIVHPLWNFRVTASGTQARWGRIILSDISKEQE
jgi:hypothetical protein